MAIIALVRPGPRTATRTRARSSEGKARMMSITRMITVSIQPPHIARDQADGDARRHGDDDDDHADEERIAGAEYQSREDVAADGVGAQKIGEPAAFLPGRRDQQRVTVLNDGRMGRDQRREDGDQNDESEDDEADDRPLVFGEVEPELLQHLTPGRFANPVVANLVVADFAAAARLDVVEIGADARFGLLGLDMAHRVAPIGPGRGD